MQRLNAARLPRTDGFDRKVRLPLPNRLLEEGRVLPLQIVSSGTGGSRSLFTTGRFESGGRLSLLITARRKEGRGAPSLTRRWTGRMALPPSNEPLRGGREALPVSGEPSGEGGSFSLFRRWRRSFRARGEDRRTANVGFRPFRAGWVGAAYLALKRQAIQISPFQGEGGDKPLPYVN